MRIKEAAFLVLFFVVLTVTFSISLFEIFSSLFLILSFIAFFKERTPKIFKGAFIFCMAVYFFMNLLSVTQSGYLWTSARGVFKVLRQILLCLAVIFVLDSESKLKKIIQWILAVGLFISIDALAQGLTDVEFLRGRKMTPLLADVGRLTGPFHHANDFSAYLTVLFILFLSFSVISFQGRSFKKRLFYWVGLGLTASCLLGTYSRGAWIAVIVTWVIAVFIQKSRFLAVLLLALVFWTVFFTPPLVKMRLTAFSERNGGTFVERRELWGESIRMIRQKPWLGLGVNTYARNEPYYKSGKPNIDNQYAHNGYLQMAAEIGLLGLASFLVLLAVFFAGTLPVFANSPNAFLRVSGTGLTLGILAFLLHSMTDTDLHSLVLINWFWILLGIAWAARNQALWKSCPGLSDSHEVS